MAVKIVTRVDDRGVKKTFAILTDNSAAKVNALQRSMQLIGFVAVDEFMEFEQRKTSASPSTTKLHIDTGRLARSLVGQFSFARGSGGTQDSIRRIQIRGDDFRATFGTSVPYSVFWDPSPRPFLTPAAEAVAERGDIEKIFVQEIKRHVRRAQN